MGLAAALCWGSTDFLIGINARAVGVRRAVFFSQAIGFVIFSAWLWATAAPWLEASASIWGLALLAASLTVGGTPGLCHWQGGDGGAAGYQLRGGHYAVIVDQR